MKLPWIWASLAALAALIALGVLSILLISPAPWLDDGVFLFAGVPYALVGALIAIRKQGQAIGTLMVIIGSAWLLGEASRAYLWLSLHVELPANAVAAWLVSWIFSPACALIPALFCVFPSGRVSPWLRRPIRVYFPFVALLALYGMFAPQDLGDGYGDYLAGITNPVGSTSSRGWVQETLASWSLPLSTSSR